MLLLRVGRTTKTTTLLVHGAPRSPIISLRKVSSRNREWLTRLELIKKKKNNNILLR